MTNNDLDESISDIDWAKQKIANAQSKAALNVMAETIRYDVWEKAAYTQDAASLAELRALWRQRADEIAKQLTTKG